MTSINLLNNLFRLGVLGFLLTGSVASGDIIYEASSTNTTLFTNNGNNLANVSQSGDTSTGIFSLTHPTDTNQPFGIASNQDLQTLNGGAITSSDVVTLRYTLDDISVGDLQNIGLEFGLVDGPNFRNGGTEFYVNLRGNGQTSTVVNTFSSTAVSPLNIAPLNEASLEDGVEVVITLDNAGYSVDINGAFEEGMPANTVFNQTGTFAPDEFVNAINDSHFYTTAQRSNAGNTSFVANFSELSVHVATVAVPEPSSAVALWGGAFVLCIRRRRSR